MLFHHLTFFCLQTLCNDLVISFLFRWIRHSVYYFLSLCMKEIKILHCKKTLSFFPSPAGMSLTKLSLAGKISLVSDIPAGNGKNDNLFLQCNLSQFEEVENLSTKYSTCFHSAFKMTQNRMLKNVQCSLIKSAHCNENPIYVFLFWE